ncbi:MAG: DnaJ domain-containing protein, partial [Gammaproteobacteria bacterium]|nr:DnaJ domain-containing protein [Gammaproteobacteria bacterium]
KPAETSKNQSKDQSKEQSKEKPQHNESHKLRVVGNSNTAEKTEQAFPQTESPLSDSKPVWWDLVALAVNYHREPEKFKTLTSSKTPIPDGIADSFKIAIGKMLVPDYLRSGDLSNVSDQDIRDALRFYIRNVLLSNTADYYRRLGVGASASFEEIRLHYKYLFRLFQPDKEQNASNWDETYTRRINQAYGTLRAGEKRKEYDEFLAALKTRTNKSKVSQEKVDEKELASSDDVLPGAVTAEKENRKLIIDDSANEAPVASSDSSIDTAESGKNGFSKSLILASVGLVLFGAAFYFMKTEINSSIENIDVSESSPTQTIPAQEVIKPILVLDAPVADAQSGMVEAEASEAALAESNESSESNINIVEEQLSEVSVLSTKPVSSTKPVFSTPPASLTKPAPVGPSIIASPVESASQRVLEPVSTSVTSTQRPVTNSVKIKSPGIELTKAKELKVVTPKVVATLPVVAVLPKVESKTGPKAISKAEPATIIEKKKIESKNVESKKEISEKTETAKKSENKTTPITQNRLSDFVTDFSLAYEEGNLDAFMTFFTDDASTNEAVNKLAIRKDYEGLFGSTEMRVIDLEKLNWKIKKQKAVGKGGFVLTVLGKGGGKVKNFSGLIKLEVVNVNNLLKIKGMFHAYGANE